MKCIVTAGPTYEELDDVRRLTNFSTGTLGTELANYLVDHGHEVELLRGHYSTCQIEPTAQSVQVFTTTLDLQRRLKGLPSGKFGAVFHAAAVSDFAKSRKIPTKGGMVLAELKPTAKIIGHLRDWFPKAQLVGWKYEVDSGRARAIALAERQMKENSTDACVVNGPAYGNGYALVNGPALILHLRDKKALFAALEEMVEM